MDTNQHVGTSVRASQQKVQLEMSLLVGLLLAVGESVSDNIAIARK